MIKACKKYIKTFKTHFKKSKNAKKIEADKQRLLALYEEYKYVWE
ncbi:MULTISPECIES: hypothetical protein [Helicobacter]|nr:MULTISPECIES: hypothetical protein [Helicobacter]